MEYFYLEHSCEREGREGQSMSGKPGPGLSCTPEVTGPRVDIVASLR